MLPNIPRQMQQLVSSLPKAQYVEPKTTNEKIAELKKKFKLQHGKGKRKKKK